MKRSKKSGKCPRCASKDIMLQDSFDDGVDLYVCVDCDYEFEVGGSTSRDQDEDFDFDEEADFDNADEEWEN